MSTAPAWMYWKLVVTAPHWPEPIVPRLTRWFGSTALIAAVMSSPKRRRALAAAASLQPPEAVEAWASLTSCQNAIAGLDA